MPDKVVLLLDGGFVKKKLQARLGRFPSALDIVSLCNDIMQHSRCHGANMFASTTTMRRRSKA
jgi:hypothetical protein